MERIEELKTLLSTPKKITIIPHTRPDADALGSCLGLLIYLEKMQHECIVVSPSEYPRFLEWMPAHEKVVVFKKENERGLKEIKEADIIFCLDFNALNRIGDLEGPVKEAKAAKVMIDHHLEPDNFADFSWSETSAAATAELIYEFLLKLGNQATITKDIGECLYAGIMTDTGSFRFASTSSRVHRIIADLIDIGVDNAKIHQNVYDNNTEVRLRLLGYLLLKKLVIIKDLDTAYISITKEEAKEYNMQTGDSEGVVNYALSIRGIKIAAMFKETEEGFVKISFRSTGEIAVNKLAKEYFGGGGHKNAAGGRSDLSLKDTLDKFNKLLKEHEGKF